MELCPLYGFHASPVLRVLLNSHGNQCALATGRYAPCLMEQAGAFPFFPDCPRVLTAREAAEDMRQWERHD